MAPSENISFFTYAYPFCFSMICCHSFRTFPHDSSSRRYNIILMLMTTGLLCCCQSARCCQSTVCCCGGGEKGRRGINVGGGVSFCIIMTSCIIGEKYNTSSTTTHVNIPAARIIVMFFIAFSGFIERCSGGV